MYVCMHACMHACMYVEKQRDLLYKKTKLGGGSCTLKNRYVTRTCVCYLEIQQSCEKEGNARFANAICVLSS